MHELTERARRTAPFALAVAVILAITPGATLADAHGSDIDKGREVFASVAGLGCKSCHGDYAEGDLGVGPFIRGATEGTIRASIDATNEMVVIKNTITEDEIAAVAAYVNHLGSLQVARTLSKRGRFMPDSFTTRPGTRLQIIVKNAGMKPATYQTDDMGLEPFTVPGRSTAAIEWRAPDTEGECALYCSDCKLTDQKFFIRVSADAPEFRGSTLVAAGPDSGGM